MKILYIITGLGGGGAEKVVADLADQMHIRGNDIKIAYLKGKEPIVKPNIQGIELIYLGFESPIHFISASKRLRELIKNFQPDVIHSHMIHANIFSRLNRIGLSVSKLICTAHNSNEGGFLRMLAYQLTDFLSDINTNVSVEATKTFINKKAFNSKAITIYNGINLEKFKYIKDMKSRNNEIIKLLAVGRLVQQKDYSNLLYALSILRKIENKEFKLFIVGEGDQENIIKQLIKNLSLEDCVELLGRRNDIPELMSSADIFVLSSLFEGFGLVVAEAMSCGTFVVATDCGGVKEVMGGNGFLVPPKDSDALAKALQDAIHMSEVELHINNTNALNHIRHNFDLQLIVEKWVHLYEQ